MKIPLTLWQGGTHGNFLLRLIRIAAGDVEDFDIFDSHRGAHADPRGEFFQGTFWQDTCRHGPNPGEQDFWVMITLEPEDLYVAQWHTFWAAGEVGFDVVGFRPAESEQLESYLTACVHNPDYKSSRRASAQALLEHVQHFDPSADGVREMFKCCFRDTNGMIVRDRERRRTLNIQHCVPFDDLYHPNRVREWIRLLVQDLGYKYTVDIRHHAERFVERKKPILASRARVQQAFQAWRQGEPYGIHDFWLYEQAYLEHLIEQHTQTERPIDFPHGYPQSVEAL